MSRKLVVLMATLLAGAALAVSGCGGGSDDSATGETTADTTAVETTEAESTDTDTESTETDDSSTDASAEDCSELADLSTKLGQAFSGSANPDTKDYAEFLEAFADRAPDEIRDDFKVLSDSYAQIAEALEGVDTSPGATPDPEDIAKLQELVGKLDQAKLTEASTNVSVWVQENCTPGG